MYDLLMTIIKETKKTARGMIIQNVTQVNFHKRKRTFLYERFCVNFEHNCKLVNCFSF